jgi:hypothetical protein
MYDSSHSTSEAFLLSADDGDWFGQVKSEWYTDGGNLRCRPIFSYFNPDPDVEDRGCYNCLAALTPSYHESHADLTAAVGGDGKTYINTIYCGGTSGHWINTAYFEAHEAGGTIVVTENDQNRCEIAMDGTGGGVDWSFEQPAIDMRYESGWPAESAVCVYTGWRRESNACTSVVFYNRGWQEDIENGGGWSPEHKSEHGLMPGTDNNNDNVHQSHPTVAFSSPDPSTQARREVVVFEDSNAVTGAVKLRRAIRKIGPGQTDTLWSRGDVFPAASTVALVNPHLQFDNDTFYLTYTTQSRAAGLSSVHVMFSTDNGATWSAPMCLSTGLANADSANVYVKDGRVAYAIFGGDADVYFRRGDLWYYPLVPTPGPGDAGRIARATQAGYVHAAYRVEDYINYDVRDQSGDVVYQDAPDFGDAPTLALSPGGGPVVAYRRNDSILSAAMNADSGWTIKTVFAAPSGQHVGPPSLGVFQSADADDRMGNCCFPVYDTVSTNSMILYAQFDTAGSVVLDTVHFNSGKLSDSSACLAVGATDTISVCYNSGDSIYMKKLVFSPTSMTRPDAWSSASLVDSGYAVSARHAAVEKVGSRLWVVYSQKRVQNDTTLWAIKQVSCSLLTAGVTWEGLTTVDTESMALKDYPSISTSKVVAWAESSGTHWVIKASVDDSVLTLTGDTNCKCVSIIADTAVQTTPSTSTTGIYFTWLQKLAGDTWAAKYASKQVLTSNADANVTRYNQGRKLLLSTDDTLSSVYRTTQGSIYYSKKKDGVEGWTSSLLRSTGQFPCLANDYLNRTWVAEQDVSIAPPSQVIRCQNRAAGSNSWHDFQVYSVSSDGPANAKIGPPSIVACQNDSGNTGKSAAYIVFTVYTTIPMKSTIVMAKVDTLGVWYVDTLHYVTTYGDSFPSIAASPVAGPGYGLDVAWQYGTEVYVKKTTNAEHPEFLTKRTWSGNCNLSNTAGKSRHAQIAADDTVLVAWVEGDSGRILVKGQAPGSSYNTWNDTVNVSACGDTVCDSPTIALGDSIIVTYQKKLSSANYDVIARVNFHSNLNLSNSATTSKYPHCLFHFHDGSPVISTVWTEELSTNYAEVAYKRWQLGEEDGGGIQDYSIFDPNIRPALFAPAPNPFNGLTNIRYATNIKGMTRVSVMDITGRRVRNLLTMPQSPGIYNLTWSARDDRERQLPRGVYFVRLETANYSEARKLILTE